VRKNLAGICLKTSINGILAGGYSSNAGKSIFYLKDKYNKGRMK